jgi:hypothetical protein
MPTGTDGIRLWNLPKIAQMENPGRTAGSRGATTAFVWIRREDDLDEVLFYGTQNGHLVCWKQTMSQVLVSACHEDRYMVALTKCQIPFEELHCVQLANPGEITGLAFDATSNHLIACNQNSMIQLFMIDGLIKTHIIFSIAINNLDPKAVAFRNINGNMKDVLAFGLYNGQMSVFWRALACTQLNLAFADIPYVEVMDESSILNVSAV